MIFTNVSITVKEGKSTQDNDIYIYRGDRNIEVRFTIESPFRYTDISNLIEDSDAYYAQLVIKKPNSEDDFIYSSIEPTEYGVAKLMITAEMIDETIEVGEYDYQIILYDESNNSRVTIPPIIGGIKLLEPISLEVEKGGTYVNEACVGYAILPQMDENLETFNEEKKYNKTDWKDGDLITDGKLNKIEDALDKINEKANGVVDEIENEMKFETDGLVINSLGGISAGTDLNGLSVKDILNKLLYPHVKPTVSVSTIPEGGIYEHGDYKTITNIKVVITKKTDQIKLLRILDGNEVIFSKDTSIESGGTFNVSCNITVTDSRRFTAEVTDMSDLIVTANTSVFNYIYPYYYGIANESTLLNGEFLKTLVKRVEVKGEKTLSYTTNNQRMVFAYPIAYGKLSKILDMNGFDVTNTFTVTTTTLVALDGTTQSYYVYANNPSTVENFTMKFSY